MRNTLELPTLMAAEMTNWEQDARRKRLAAATAGYMQPSRSYLSCSSQGKSL